SRPTRQRGDETVQFAVQVNVFDDLAAVRLESRSEVVQIDSAQLSHQPICGATGQSPGQQCVLSFQAPSADDVVPLIQLREERGDLLRVVLKISVHRNDHVAASEIKAGLQARRLAEVFAEANNDDVRIVLRDVGKNGERLIAAAVIYKNDLVGFTD